MSDELHVSDIPAWDPLHVEAAVQEAWEAGYRAGLRDAAPPVVGVVLGLILAILAGTVLGAFLLARATSASPGSVQLPAGPTPEAPAGLRASLPPAPPVNETGLLRVVLPPDPISPPADAALTGEAKWCAPTPRYCKGWGGNARVGAMRSFTFGDLRYDVRVCRADDPGRCVTVTVVSYCACGSAVIDLSPAAFSRLEKLSRGHVRVTVTRLMAAATLPPTDQ